MTWTLLTNDDGIDSPALPAFAAALALERDVRVVAPDRERSWVGKAITRFEPITVRDTTRGGHTMYGCSGYPADAVQLGVDGLFDSAPSLVVSGINLGYNHGAGFLISSGTVGAAIEGWVSGVPAVAFSTGTIADDVTWHEWRSWALSADAHDHWGRLAALCAQLVTDLVDADAFLHADVISVNLPWDATEATQRRVTSIARVGYDRLFRHVGDRIFVHDFGGGIREFATLDGTDVDAARDGVVSITPILMPAAAAVPADLRSRLERHGPDTAGTP